MKKIFSIALAVVAMMITACAPSQKEVAEKIAEKMAQGETLSENEYTQAFNYTEDVLKIINDSIAAHKDDFQGLINSFKAINDEYPEANILMSNLLSADPATLDEANRALQLKLIKSVESMTEDVAKIGPIMRDPNFGRNPALEKMKEDAAKVDGELKADSLSAAASEMKQLESSVSNAENTVIDATERAK